MDDAQQQLAQAYLEEFLQLARKAWPELSRRPTVSANPRLRTTAGRAFPKRWHIEFNPLLCHREGDGFLYQVIGHELAHLLDHRLHARQGHGDSWRSVMRTLRLDPQRTHSGDTDGLRPRRRRYLYQCACNDPIELGPVRHRNAQAGGQYRCRSCHTTIRWTGQSVWGV